MKKIIIAGGSGYLGTVLSKFLINKNYDVYILSRNHRIDEGNKHYIYWDATNMGSWCQYLEGAHAIINLAGRSVDCRYNDRNKALIYNSRISTTFLIGNAINACLTPPKYWINSSSATIYENSFHRNMTEKDGILGQTFSEDVCKKWETTLYSFNHLSTYITALRTGIVIGKKAPVFRTLTNLCKMRVGKRQGRGNQYISWIHEADFVSAIDHILQSPKPKKVYNVTSPEPIPNYTFMKSLSNKLENSFQLPLPTWLLTIGAKIIGTETELVLKSRKVIPLNLLEDGFDYQYPTADLAIGNLLMQVKTNG